MPDRDEDLLHAEKVALGIEGTPQDHVPRAIRCRQQPERPVAQATRPPSTCRSATARLAPLTPGAVGEPHRATEGSKSRTVVAYHCARAAARSPRPAAIRWSFAASASSTFRESAEIARSSGRRSEKTAARIEPIIEDDDPPQLRSYTVLKGRSTRGGRGPRSTSSARALRQPVQRIHCRSPAGGSAHVAALPVVRSYLAGEATDPQLLRYRAHL